MQPWIYMDITTLKGVDGHGYQKYKTYRLIKSERAAWHDNDLSRVVGNIQCRMYYRKKIVTEILPQYPTS